MLRAIGNQIANVRELVLPPWSSAALLQLARHALIEVPTEFGMDFLDMTVRGIVPIIVSAHLRLFLSDLKDYFSEYHRVWPEFRVLSLWFVQKQCAYVDWSISQFCADLIVSMVIGLERRLFTIMSASFFSWFADLLSGPNFHTAMTMLGIIVSHQTPGDEYQEFVKSHSSAIIHRCCGAIMALAQGHWQTEVRARAEEALKTLAQLNPIELQQEQKRRQSDPKAPHGRRSWLRIAASVNWEDLPGTKETMDDQITELYESLTTNGWNPRFMPCPRDPGSRELYKAAFQAMSGSR
jgi:hypothetical protein